MTDGVNICRTLDLRNPRLIGDDVSHYKIQRRRNVAQRGRELLPGLLAHLQGHNRFPADAFHFTLAQAVIFMLLDAIKVGGNHLKLQAGTSRVEYQYVHDVSSLSGTSCIPANSCVPVS